MVQGKKIGDRAFVVRRLRDTQQIRNCQILFVAAPESKRTRTLLETLKGTGILTVGETEDFTATGGLIGLKLEGTRVHIQIELETAERTPRSSGIFLPALPARRLRYRAIHDCRTAPNDSPHCPIAITSWLAPPV